MGKKQLVINLFANIISFITSLGLAFGLTPYLISTLGKEAYGFYPMSNNFIGYLMIISIALNSMASRFITIEIVKNNLEKAKGYYSSVFFANLIMSVILSIPMILIIMYLDFILNIPNGLLENIRNLFILVFGSMLITVITSVFGVATFAKNRLDLRSSGEIFQGLLKLILYLFLFSSFETTIEFIGLVSLILSITNLLLQIYFTRKLLPGFNISYQRFSFTSVKELLSSGVWNSINSLGSLLLLGVSLLLANIYLGASAAGELSIVQILPTFITSIISMLFAVFMPRITHTFAVSDKIALLKEVKLSQKVIGLFSTTPIVLVIIFGKEFFTLWVPSENAISLQILSTVTLIPLIIHGNMWSVYGLNIVLNRVKVPSLTLIILGLLNVIVCYIILEFYFTNLLVIPIVSGIINLVYYFGFIPLYASNNLKVSKLTFYHHIFKAVIFSLILVTIGYIIKPYFYINTWIEFFFYGGLIGIIGILLNGFFILSKEDFSKITSLNKNIIYKFKYKNKK